jgi:hypothetical protein
LACSVKKQNESGIRPYYENPRYWQYKGEPVLLLGASDDDNLFQFPELKKHLDLLSSAGGNYIRNTMSSRDTGNVWPFYQDPDGRYDLEKWNEEYWNKFNELLRLADERNIIIQIEIWDRFDYSRDPWNVNPFNPANNVNYSSDISHLEFEYPDHPSADVQPFFHTIPGMPLYKPGSEIIKKFQEKFVDKILSFTLEYGNILYCMDNETNTPPAWGKYWMKYILEKAGRHEIFTTDMFDEFYKPKSCPTCQAAIGNPEEYLFLDVSQINSRNFSQSHWDTLRWIMNMREKYMPRPVNCTKVYGGGQSGFGSGTNMDGVERFYRNVIGGIAAVRHHRPPTGNGLNENAVATIKTIRNIESIARFWDLKPKMELLAGREENEAYISGNERNYVMYFPKGGSVSLPMTGQAGYSLRWIDAGSGNWDDEMELEAAGSGAITTPDTVGGWFVVINKR